MHYIEKPDNGCQKQPFLKPKIFVVELETESIIAESEGEPQTPVLTEDDLLEGILGL